MENILVVLAAHLEAVLALVAAAGELVLAAPLHVLTKTDATARVDIQIYHALHQALELDICSVLPMGLASRQVQLVV